MKIKRKQTMAAFLASALLLGAPFTSGVYAQETTAGTAAGTTAEESSTAGTAAGTSSEASSAEASSADQQNIVVTLGADLTEEQKASILDFFGVDADSDSVTILTITNADEREQLEGLISDEEIGTRTLSCALVRPTTSGGIQVKTANMNYVTSNMIASTLSTSGVYNCEVLTAAPFEVSGTGALTGVMMAYESANGEELDPVKKELANEELVTTEEVAATVGQEEATLIVNNIKIHIVRDQLTDEQEVYDAVESVLTVTENAAAEAAEEQGKEAPAKLSEEAHQKLKDFGYEFSQQSYDYIKMRATLERVTTNITSSTGIDDPITDTFTNVAEDQGLSSDSVLLQTDDKVLGEGVNINSTNNGAVTEKEADPIVVSSGDVVLTSAGGIKATEFISGTNILAYQDLNGSYALMDLDGMLLTDAVYQRWFTGKYGYIIAALDNDTEEEGLLASDGSTLIDFTYYDVKIMGRMWACGITVTPGGTEADHDYGYGDEYYRIDTVDLYYLGTQGSRCVKSFTREEYEKLTDYCAEADYINFKDESGTVTTYNSSFEAVGTPDSLYDFGEFDQEEAVQTALAEETGYYIYNFYGDYTQFSDLDSGDNGIIDRYGNIIVPAEFDSFQISYSDNSYESGGYFAGTQDDQFVYTQAGGTVTAAYSYDPYDVISYGMAARVKKDDGGFVLLSGDGIETDLGTTYSSFYCIYASKGLLWYGETANGKEDLLDWHGNVLLSGCDGYSVSANGNYLIAEDGYTSSSIYRINDASEITIGESAGAASELESTIVEGASLEAYTGDPEVTEAGEFEGAVKFIKGTDLLLVTEDGEHYAIEDVTGVALTETIYSDDCKAAGGWIRVADAEETGYGILSAKTGEVILPTEYDSIDILNKNWIVAYKLTDGTEEDYDFTNYSDGYYQIETAEVYHMGSEITSMELTRDQIADIDAEGDYLSIEDRTTEKSIIYDSTFTPVSSADYVGDFGEYTENYTLIQQLQDSTGYSIYTHFLDGYVIASEYSSESGTSKQGVIDMSGNVIIPVEYDRVVTGYSENTYVSMDITAQCLVVNGYFIVEKDDMYGFVKENGEVTCELKYSSDNFTSNGMSAVYKTGDESYVIVSGDGQESENYTIYPHSYAGGLFYRVSDSNNNYHLVDWHGNMIFEDIYDISFSSSGKYILLTKEYKGTPVLYTIDGAELISAADAAAAEEAAEANKAGEDADAEDADASDSDASDTDADGDANGADGTDGAGSTGKGSSAGSAEALDMLDSALNLITIDFAANKSTIASLLSTAQADLASQNPDAAAQIGSALSLINSDSATSAAVADLVTSAMGMIQ